MSSEGMSTGKKAIIGGLVAGAVLGGAYLVLAGGKKKDEKEEDAAFGTDTHKSDVAAAKPQPPPLDDDGPVVETTSTPSGAVGNNNTSSAPTSTMESPNTANSATFSQVNSNYNFNENKKNAGKLDEVHPSTGSPKTEFPAEVVDGAKHFEKLGVVAKLPSDWDCKQEVSPVPTASMITFAKAEFAHVPPPSNPMEFGRVPVVLLSVEDIALEGLTPKEYAEKKKMIGLQQLMMMTQGMFQPRIVHEGSTDTGPFEFMLEYEQPQPPMQISVLDLFTVKQGFAYCMQIMAKPEVVSKFKQEFFTIARGIDLYPHPLATSFAPCACLRVRTGTIESACPPSWRVRQTKGCLVFHTLSQAKTDSVKVCKSTDEPVLDLLAGGQTVSEKKLADGVTLTVVKEGRKESKLVQKGDFAVIAEPLKTNSVTVTDEFLVEIATLTSACDATAGTYYESSARGFRFEIPNPKAMIMESRVGDGAILYSPEGLDAAGPQGPEPGAPALTIRVEDPSTDSDCMSDLDAWHNRILGEAAADNTMQDVKRGIVAGRDSVYFMSKDMVEIGPGQREERAAKIVIFVNQEGRTHMLRWEASTGNYRKTERNFDALLESYQLI